MPDSGKACDGKGCEKAAVVHVTQVVDGKTSHYHLCSACAEAKGISPSSGSTLGVSAFLAQLGDASSSSSGPTDPCTFCGLTFSQFKNTGRLGCPQCYTSFEASLRRLLQRIHGAAEHTGKVYLTPDPAAVAVDQRLIALRSRLQRAVDAEDFERAAQLRDQILELQPAG